MKRFIFIINVVWLGGCTLLSPENELRVTEYDGSGWYMTASGAAAGCRVVRAGVVYGCMRYHGEHCEYESEDCADKTVKQVAILP